MANNGTGGQGNGVQKPTNGLQEQEFDIDADLQRLKKSSYVMIAALVILVAAFFILMILSLTGTFALQQTTDVPAMIKFVYPVADGVAVTREASTESETVMTLEKTDRLYEIKRIPGYVRVEWEKHAGWVDAGKVKTRLEGAAAAAGLTGAPLEVVMNVEIYQKDILISGKVVNNSDKALRNIHLMVSFLDINRLTINTESTTLATREELPAASAVPFNLVGRNLLGRTSFVAWEIPALELAKPPATIPAGDDQGAGPEPAAPPAPPPAKKTK